MSRPSEETIPCPECGKKQKFTTWKSLNVTLDPDKKQSLLDGSLTRFTCSGCGHSADVTYSLLYHDMERSFMAWYIPPAPDGKAGDAPAEEAAEMFKRMGASYRFRVVRSHNELKEKIFIFDAGLDDRIIELAKVVSVGQFPDDKKDADVFFSGVTGVGEKATLDFTIISAGKVSGIRVTKDAMYNMLAKSFAPALAREPAQPWITIDRNYAWQLISENAEKKAAGSSAGRGASPQRSRRKWWPFGR